MKRVGLPATGPADGDPRPGAPIDNASTSLEWLLSIAQSVHPRIESFDVDTRITSRLGGIRLSRFWFICQTESRGRLPDLKKRPGSRIFESVIIPLGVPVSLVCGIFVAFQLGAGPFEFIWLTWFAGLVSFGLRCIGLLPFVLFVNLLHRWVFAAEGIFPNDLKTFGLIADVIRGARGGWCIKCNYELTGLTSERCPECGTWIKRFGWWTRDK